MSESKLSLDQHRDAIAANLPTGRLWRNKNVPTSNLYKLLAGLAPTFLTMDEVIQAFVTEAIPFTTVLFLEEWEECLGIPDDCIPLATTIEQRQRNIGIKLLMMRGVQTRPDFVALAKVYGFLDYKFHSGIEHMPASEGGYELYLPELSIAGGDFGNIQDARYTLVVVEGEDSDIGFPWEFPLLFAAEGQVELRCIINKIIPSTHVVIFVEEPS